MKPIIDDDGLEYDDDDYFYCVADEWGFECSFPDCDCELMSIEETEGFSDDDNDQYNDEYGA